MKTLRINKLSFLVLLMLIFKDISLSAQNETAKSDTIFDGHAVSSDWIDHGLILGLDFSKYFYGEIDYYRSYIWAAGWFPTLSTTINYGAEFSYFDEFIVAPKIQGRIHAYFFNTSLTALCYTDFNKDYAIKLRPEIGVGLWNIDINYGFNIRINKNGFDQYNRHVIALRYYLKLHRKHLGEYDRNGNKRPYDE